MTKCNRTLALLAASFAASALLTPSLTHAQAVVVGVNLLNSPDKLSASDQETTLDNMKNAGVRYIRTGISNDDKGLEFAQRVYAHGIKILWLAGVKGPASTETTLSADQPEQFRAYFQPLLAKLEGKGMELAGIELGNEINWSNRDLNYTGGGRVLGLEDLSRDPEGQQVAKGYLQYIKVLAELKDIRDHSQLNQHTPVITAGLTDWEPGPAGTTGSKRDAVGLRATIQFMRANGMDQFVDGYGVHHYPKGGNTPAAVRMAALQNNVFAECGSGGKPCWLTEWSLPVNTSSCPVVDDKRTAIFTELRNDFSQFIRQGRLRGIFFFAWQGDIHANGSYDAFLCGSLSKSGRLAISPF